jgi:hypothetical protein
MLQPQTSCPSLGQSVLQQPLPGPPLIRLPPSQQAFEDMWERFAGGRQRMTPADVARLVVAKATPRNPFGA